jgi:hypothetical protein
MNRKAWKLICVKPCFFGGVQYHKGDKKVFYSLLKAKHFMEKIPDCFISYVKENDEDKNQASDKANDKAMRKNKRNTREKKES